MTGELPVVSCQLPEKGQRGSGPLATLSWQLTTGITMGQKINPLGYRIGITEDWKSKWYAPKAAFSEFLGEDYRIRKYVDQKLNRKPPFAAVSDILIERT